MYQNEDKGHEHRDLEAEDGCTLQPEKHSINKVDKNDMDSLM
jgi:hypothetical protein